MAVSRVFAVLGAFFLVGNSALLRADPDLYSFPEVGSTKTPAGETPKPADPFAVSLAKKMEVPEQILSEAVQKGMGRLEIIRLILISKKSQKPLPDLIQAREKLTRFSKIAQEAKVDNREITKEAKKVLKELEAAKAAPAAGTEPAQEKKQ